MLAHPHPPEPCADAAAWEERRVHVRCSAPPGPGGLCRVMGLCLSTIKLLYVPCISGDPGKDPGKDPFRGCTEHTIGPQIHGTTRDGASRSRCLCACSSPSTQPGSSTKASQLRPHHHSCDVCPPSTVSKVSGNTTGPPSSPEIPSRFPLKQCAHIHTAGHGWE